MNHSPIKFSYINEYFDHVYVLNLKKRTDRKLAMLQKLQRLRIRAEFVEAVNGYSMKNKAEFEKYKREPLSHPIELIQKRKKISSPGAWGYLKTYRAILKDAKRKNYSRILCFDDDAIFHLDFENQLKLKTQQLRPDWKILYLGASQHKWTNGHSMEFPDNFGELSNDQKPFYYARLTDGSFATGIDSSVYDLLLSEINAMNCPFDSGPLRVINQIFPEKCLVIQPNLVIADVTESDIRKSRDQQEIATKFRWDTNQYDFPTSVQDIGPDISDGLFSILKLSEEDTKNEKRSISKYKQRLTSVKSEEKTLKSLFTKFKGKLKYRFKLFFSINK